MLSSVNNAWKAEFVYDGLMRRRVRRDYGWTASGWVQTNEVRYVYDGRLVIQERDGNNTPKVTYTRGIDLSGSLEGAGGIGGLLARSEPSALNPQLSTTYYHSDGNGNITCMINSNNAVVARYHYDPYGNILSMSGPLAEANLYRFSSKEFHPNSGLVYYLYRYYEPNLQRWINRDPIGERGGINHYRYLGNTPTHKTDAWGLRLIIVPDGPPGYASCVANAQSRLSETEMGQTFNEQLVDKDVYATPSDSTSTGSATHAAADIQLTAEDPDFIPHEFRENHPEEVPSTSPSDPWAGPAVVLGHELGHALNGTSDPFNVTGCENLIRRDLGIPPRPAYHGVPLTSEEPPNCPCLE